MVVRQGGMRIAKMPSHVYDNAQIQLTLAHSTVADDNALDVLHLFVLRQGLGGGLWV